MEDKVQVINLTNSKVVLTLPEFHYQREWARKNAKVMVPKDILREAIWQDGVRALFEEGVLYIEDLEFKKELELEPEEVTAPVNIIKMDEKQIHRYLTAMPVFEFKDSFTKLTASQREEVAYYAVDHNIVNEKTQIIKEISGYDVMKAIALKQLNEEVVADGTEDTVQ